MIQSDDEGRFGFVKTRERILDVEVWQRMGFQGESLVYFVSADQFIDGAAICRFYGAQQVLTEAFVRQLLCGLWSRQEPVNLAL